MTNKELQIQVQKQYKIIEELQTEINRLRLRIADLESNSKDIDYSPDVQFN